MKTSTGATRSIIAIATSLWAGPAFAQLWNPLDTVPRPNAIVGHDVSVTMGIEPDCSSCHGAGDPRTRLDLAKQDILQTLPLFKDYFTFGGFEYSGCDYAKIVPGTRILPTPANPDTSYTALTSQISAAVHCGSRENRFPSTSGSSGCITPTAGCTGDFPIILQILQGGIVGFDPRVPWAYAGCVAPALQAWCPDCAGNQVEGGPCHWSGTPPNMMPTSWAQVAIDMVSIPDPALRNISTCTQGWCTNPVVNCDAGGSYQTQAALLSKLQSMQWPRWYDGNITGAEVQRDLCDPIKAIFDQVAAEMRACSADRYVLWPDTNRGNWCIPGQIANNACSGGSPLRNTCVCKNTDPMCNSAAAVRSDCGNLLTWKARQQVAVCESYDNSAAGRFGNYYRSQPDNVLNAGGCRENVSMFFTDGYMGGTAGTAMEAISAQPTYSSFGGRSNMFVFRVANVFTGDADAMMSAVSRGTIPSAYLATDLVNMQVSFARVLNRVYKGVYTGAAMAQDSFGSRAAFHSFTVPGYNLGLPALGDDYLNWPARISWHSVNPTTGAVNPNPIFETDWQSKANAASTCGASYTVPGGYSNVPLLGPGGNFRNGVARNVNVGMPYIDRTGDDMPDVHPPLTLGKMYSIAATRPLVVEAPHSANDGRYVSDFFTFQRATRMRPRMIITESNGFIHAFDGGTATGGSTTYGYQKSYNGYNDSLATSGAEIFRFSPTWVNETRAGWADYTLGMNDLVQQPIMTGQLTAADVHILNPANGTQEWVTVLAASQGRTGGGYVTMNISNPCAARVLAQWRLPNMIDRATNDPIIYTVATAAANPKFKPALIVTGGLGGSANIYAYDVANGAMLFSRALPGGQSYPTSPVCADVTGEERMTHCYVVSDIGRLIRVELGYNGGFTAVADITPPGINAGMFSTSPAVFFGPNGDPAIVFGSGDHKNLTTAGGQNYIYKVVDRTARKRMAGPANLAQACGTAAAPRNGTIALRPGERLISPPIVSKGTIAWTGYTPVGTGCASGSGNLYAMKYDSCDEAIDPVPPGTPVRNHGTGSGIPAQPAFHRSSERLIVSKSNGPTAAQAVTSNVDSRGGVRPVTKKLYWRPQQDTR